MFCMPIAFPKNGNKCMWLIVHFTANCCLNTRSQRTLQLHPWLIWSLPQLPGENSALNTGLTAGAFKRT